MDSLILQHIYACALTQDLLDSIVKHHVKQRIPRLGEVIEEHRLQRLRDTERVQMFLAVVEDRGNPLGLQDFETVYLDAIKLRNRLTHGGTLPSTVPGEVIVVPTPHGRDKRKNPDQALHMNRDDFTAHLARAEWMKSIALYSYVQFGAGVVSFHVGDDQPRQPVTLPVPPNAPPPASVVPV